MSDVENPPNTLNLQHIGSGTKYAAISFLIQLTLLGPIISLLSLMFDPVSTGVFAWLVVISVNIYLFYKFSHSKTKLDHLYISNEDDRQVVFRDYQAYLNVKARLKGLVHRGFLAFGAMLVFLIFGKSAAVLSGIAFVYLFVHILLSYLHLPQFLALYYLIHHYLDINPQEIEYALEAEWEKQERIEKSKEIKTALPVSAPAVQVPTPPVAEKTITTPTVDKKETPPPPPVTKNLSEIELLIKALRERLTDISITQIRSFHSLIEVLQYLEKRRTTMPMAGRKILNNIIKSFAQKITHDLEVYFNYPEHLRDQYQPEQKIIPNVWLRTRMQSYTQQLIDQTNFVYEPDLTAFKNHQKFFDQKFTHVQDFKVDLSPYAAKKILKNH